MKVKNFVTILLLLFFSQLYLVNSIQILNLNKNSSFNYLNFYEDENSFVNKISYEILPKDDLNSNLTFNLELNYKKINRKICSYNIQTNSSIIIREIICEVPKLGSGIYSFKAILLNKKKIIKILKNTYEIKPTIIENNNSNSKIIFEELGNKTKITLKVNLSSKIKSLIIENKIPKEVIKYLDKNNKDKLITSNLTYKILNSDPLIAWTIDNPPGEVSYTINKKINKKDMKNFKIDVKENKNFKYLKSIITILLIFIIIIIFKPMFFNKKK